MWGIKFGTTREKNTCQFYRTTTARDYRLQSCYILTAKQANKSDSTSDLPEFIVKLVNLPQVILYHLKRTD